MTDDNEWQAAEAALQQARRLPGGSERIEALKQAGRLRFAAGEKRQEQPEQVQPNRPGRPRKFLPQDIVDEAE